jgi:site-specific recombinase XerD
VQRGTPIQVLKELGGWETMEMVQRYAHLSADHLAQWVQPMTVMPAKPQLAAI